MNKLYYLALLGFIFFSSCNDGENLRNPKSIKSTEKEIEKPMKEKIAQYAVFELKSDLSGLSENQKKIIALLIEASKLMDEVYWMETYGDKNELFSRINDSLVKRYVEINYGPWDRLDENKPFVEGVGPKPKGANFYPKDMTKEEFENADLPDKASLYTLVRRDSTGKLYTIPYHKAFEKQHDKAAALLRQAAALAEDEGFKKYLLARAGALLTDDYQTSDMLWMDMKNNKIDLVIGPIETYEDQLFGYKASHEGFVLIKDLAWSERLQKYVSLLPELQEGLPVEDAYKKEKPGARSDLNAYDAVFYAGDANAGPKTIAINLPNDEEVQLKKGLEVL
jgi:hypothetical protein